MKLEDYLKLADRTGIVPFFWGDPGVGKTARIERWAKAKGYHLERLVLSQHDPTEVAGIYVAANGCWGAHTRTGICPLEPREARGIRSRRSPQIKHL